MTIENWASSVRQSIFIFLFFLPFLLFSQGQSYHWWNVKHGWDGVSSWTLYITHEPGTMGPNALPVPELKEGMIDLLGSFEFDLEGHYNTGDQTQNIFTKLNLPVSDRVSMQMWWVPYEQYQTDTIVRDFRAARGYSGEGQSVGDVYISTNIQIIKDKKGWPDLALEIALKTASGNNLEDVRFTDTPAYYFDLSGGYTFDLGKELKLRPYGMLGFYVYQTMRDDYYQNDCILWGAGFNLENKRWILKNQLAGYHGYFGAYDRPVVYRAQLVYKASKMKYHCQFQTGNESYPFHSLRLGLTMKLYEL